MLGPCSRVAIACTIAMGLGSCHGEPSTVSSASDAAAPASDAAAPDGPLPSLSCGPEVTVDDLGFEIVADDLQEPVWVGGAPGDDRLFIVGRRGDIRVVDGGSLVPEPALELAVNYPLHAEQGLLGFAFHPNWVNDKRFFVNYNEVGTRDTIIAEYRMSETEPNRADPTERRILVIPIENPHHNAGAMAFGPDGYLYIATGDDGFPERAQDPAFLHGKLLRIDVDLRAGNQTVDIDGDQTADYAIPADNPFAGPGPERGEVWAFGLRNPWRFTFDRLTGDVYIGDVGQKLREEVDVVSLSTGRGANFGWRIREGTMCVNPDDPLDDEYGPCSVPGGEVLPAVDFGRSVAAAVIGGYVYRGQCMPALSGTYFYSDNWASFFRTMRWNDGEVSDETDITDSIGASLAPTSVTSFGEDGDGELYVVTWGPNNTETNGAVYKIVPRP